MLKSVLCSWFDSLHAPGCILSTPGSRHTVTAIGTTNKPNAVDIKLRRGGRFDREIVLLSTSQEDRAKLIALKLRSFFTAVGLGTAVKVEQSGASVLTAVADAVSQRTGGYVAADIALLCDTAFTKYSLHDSGDHLDCIAATTTSTSTGSVSLLPFPSKSRLLASFDVAMAGVQPSCLRGVSMTVNSHVRQNELSPAGRFTESCCGNLCCVVLCCAVAVSVGCDRAFCGEGRATTGFYVH